MEKFYKYGLKVAVYISIISFLTTLILSFFTNYLIEGGISRSNRFVEGFFLISLEIFVDFFIIWISLVTIRIFFILKKVSNTSALVYVSNCFTSYFILFFLQIIYLVIFGLILLLV